MTVTDPLMAIGAGLTSVAFAPDGATLATGDGGGSSYLWDAATGRRVATLADSDSDGVYSIAFSPDGARLAAADHNGSSYLWNAVTGRLIATLTDPGSQSLNSVAFSPDGKMLATGDSNGHVYLWKLPGGTLTARLTNPRGQVTSQLEGEERTAVSSIAFSPGGNTLATSDTNGSAYLWRVR
jgi:WD40 repeat protein